MDLFGNTTEEPIRALSWWQPFGTAMLYHKVEHRPWDTKYRGLVLICTTLTPWERQPPKKRDEIKLDQNHQEELARIRGFENLMPYNTSAMNGHAIAVGRLKHTRRIRFDDMTYYKHELKGFAHIYEDVKRIKPFMIVGGQGWFKVTPEIRAKIHLLDV